MKRWHLQISKRVCESGELKSLVESCKFLTSLPKYILPLSSVDRVKYQIILPLPPKIDPSVTMMQVEEKPDVTYGDVGGCKEQIEKLREVVETPLLAVSDATNGVLRLSFAESDLLNIVAREICRLRY